MGDRVERDWRGYRLHRLLHPHHQQHPNLRKRLRGGYWVGKPYWNKGICTEALKLMLDYCINEKHFENIWADHFTGNPASGRVMEKCGFSDTGMLNRCSQLVGGDKDLDKVFKYTG